MSAPRGRIALIAGAVGLLACSAEERESPPEVSWMANGTQSVPACSIDPYYCSAEPFALGAWAGDTGPFAALVLSDQLCGDRGYCFVGRLTNGTRVEGWYFDRPQLVLFSWSGGAQMFEGYDVQGDVLTFYAGPEGDIVPVATLHRVASYCDVPDDCELQSLKPMPCDPAVTLCRHHRCRRNCGLPSDK